MAVERKLMEIGGRYLIASQRILVIEGVGGVGGNGLKLKSKRM